jgi:hypothetical protein
MEEKQGGIAYHNEASQAITEINPQVTKQKNFALKSKTADLPSLLFRLVQQDAT